MKTNKERLIKHIEKIGFSLGIYDKDLELLSYNNLKKVIENLKFETDTLVHINRKKFVVEIDIVEDEIDLRLLSKEEYINRYGDEFFDR